MNRDDEKLVRRLRLRDERAFEELVGRLETPILNLLYRLVGSRAEAEDLAQEVFVTVFKKIDDFRGDAALSTWVYRIAANHAKNRQKSLARQRVNAEPFEETTPPRENRAARGRERPDELVEGYETERLVQEALGALDDEHRLVLVLRDVQGLPYDEIGVITELPEGTVKSRLHRAHLT